MIANPEYRNSPLAELLALVRGRSPQAAWTDRFAAVGIALPVATMLLYMLGLVPAELMVAVIWLGWLCWSGERIRRENMTGCRQSLSGLILLHSCDATMLLGTGLVYTLAWGFPSLVSGLAAGAAMTVYLAYYSGVAFLKAVPGKMRTANLGAMVELDHGFLANSSLWGAERSIVFCTGAAGLLAGWPEAGFCAAILAGNAYWLVKSYSFWKRVRI